MALTLRVRNCITATPRSKIIRLALDPAAFPFHPGQAALLGLAGQPLRRPYSIASAPSDLEATGTLEFLVQEGSHGSLGPHLTGLTRGSRMIVEGPVGTFGLPIRLPRDQHYLFVAGGSGISPLRSMIRHVLAHTTTPRVSVAYSARTSQELAYAAELRRFARQGAIQLLLTTTREISQRTHTRQGRLTAEDFRTLGATEETQGYICGPESLVRDAPALLIDAGLAPGHVYMERW